MSEGTRGRNVNWTELRWQDLSVQQLYAILAARVQVFVVEQECAYQDLDGLDEAALHVVAWGDPGCSQVLAYARLNPPGTRFPEPSIGRVITSAAVRRTGMGRALMQRVLDAAERMYPARPMRISAQAYLEDFYRSFGFTTVSAPYLEDNLPHVEMRRPPAGELSASPD